MASATEKVDSIIDAAETAADQIKADAREDAEAYRLQRTREIEVELAARADELNELTGHLIPRIESLQAEARALTGELATTSSKLREVAELGSEPASGVATAGDSSDPEGPSTGAAEERAEALIRAADAKDARSSAKADEPADADIEPSSTVEPTTEPDADPEPDAVDSPPSGPTPAGPAPVAYSGTRTQATKPDEQPPSPSAKRTTDSHEDALLRATQLAVSGSSRSEIESALRNEFELDDVDSVLDGILGPESN